MSEDVVVVDVVNTVVLVGDVVEGGAALEEELLEVAGLEDVVDAGYPRFATWSVVVGSKVEAALAALPVMLAVARSVTTEAEMDAASDAVSTVYTDVVATASIGGAMASGVGAWRMASKSNS